MSQAEPLIGEWEPYLSMREVADWMQRVTGSQKWTANSVRDHLQRVAPEALIPMPGPGSARRKWVTTRDRLRRAFSDVWDELLLRQIEVEVEGE